MKSKIEEIPVATAKVLVYRDQVEGSWQDFQEGPLKYIVNCLKILAVCRKPGCMCESWHVGESQSEPLIDVWNRDFLTLGFKKSKPSESELFACAIRVRQEVFDDVMKQSGKSGIYIEPRSDDGKSHGDKYHTVWLSKMAFNEAVVACAKAKTPAYLIRVNRRYGLKTKVEFANELHKQFRADEPMMQGPSNITPDRESQCIHPGHASFQWDAAHSGSQRSQCKIVHFTMERRWSGMISPNDFSKTWNIESP